MPNVLALALIALLFISQGAFGQRDQYLTVAELKKALQSEEIHRVVDAMNRAKRSQESPELMSFLLQLWRGKERPSDVPWTVVENPRVRVEIANVLIQASNNRLIEFDRKEAARYSRPMATGAVRDARTTAILNLGLVGDPADIDLLKNIAIKEDAQTFRPAVISLARMCDASAEKALVDVRGRVQDGEHREFANTPSQELVPFKRCPQP